MHAVHLAGVFGATPWLPKSSSARKNVQRPDRVRVIPAEENREQNPFFVGDRVFLQRSARCDVPWSGPHQVTAVKSVVTVELDNDGVTRHIGHLRCVPIQGHGECASQSESSSSSEASDCEQFEDEHPQPVHERHPPIHIRDYVW